MSLNKVIGSTTVLELNILGMIIVILTWGGVLRKKYRILGVNKFVFITVFDAFLNDIR